MIRSVVGCVTILADASGVWVVIKKEDGTKNMAARTLEEVERVRSVFFQVVRGEQRAEAINRLLDAWQKHVEWATKAAEERVEEALLKTIMRPLFRAGDRVRHGPSGERWLLACDEREDGSVYPCGWPETRAMASDCSLVQATTDENRKAMLETVAAGNTSLRRGIAEAQLNAARLEEGRQVSQVRAPTAVGGEGQEGEPPLETDVAASNHPGDGVL